MYALEYRRLTKQRIAESIVVLSIVPHIVIILNTIKKSTNSRPTPIIHHQINNENADATRRPRLKSPAKVIKMPIVISFKLLC